MAEIGWLQACNLESGQEIGWVVHTLHRRYILDTGRGRDEQQGRGYWRSPEEWQEGDRGWLSAGAAQRLCWLAPRDPPGAESGGARHRRSPGRYPSWSPVKPSSDSNADTNARILLDVEHLLQTKKVMREAQEITWPLSLQRSTPNPAQIRSLMYMLCYFLLQVEHLQTNIVFEPIWGMQRNHQSQEMICPWSIPHQLAVRLSCPLCRWI